LKKFENPKLRNYYNDKCLEIIDDLNGEFPQTLSNDDQGRFIVGYAQQYRDLYTKKSKDKPEENSEVKKNKERTKYYGKRNQEQI
jgi:CRISPR-associated protein Csd1